MRTWACFVGLVMALSAGRLLAIDSNDLSGYVSVEGRLFFHDALFPGQEDNNGSIAGQPEYYHRWKGGSSFTFTPFGRLDSADSERTHFDIRELNFNYVIDRAEMRVGVSRVFWGTTEFVHLVDIINQTDLVEDLRGEDKLGQPMVEFKYPASWGTLDFFILPYFRERTFPGSKGRLRPGPLIDTDETIYQSPAKERAFDLAIRYSRSLGGLDFGVYYFDGTNREPRFIPGTNEANEPILIPGYEEITQFGTDAQLAWGDWLWKLEALHRDGYGYTAFATTGGFEYTFFNVAGSNTDLGVVGEYVWDERGDEFTLFDNDAMLGLRISPNDAATTHVLLGYFHDLDDTGKGLRIEGSRRIGENWRLILEAWGFFSVPKDSPYYDIRDDSFLRLELARYF